MNTTKEILPHTTVDNEILDNDANALSSSELRKVYREIETIKQETDELVRGLSAAQLAWRSAPDVWSIADCFAHLNVVNSGYYIPAVTRAVAAARESGTIGVEPFKHGLFGNLFIYLTEPPVRFRVPAPRAFVPPPDSAPHDTIESFIKGQHELQQLVRQADGIDLARTKVVSPINRRLKFTLGQAFRLLTAHERRHLWQANGVRKMANFPGN